ncbi:PAS domain S-box protein [bacterium]|nr:PAS domain S-box protein [bacterium]
MTTSHPTEIAPASTDSINSDGSLDRGELFQALLKHTPTVVWQIDAAGRFTYSEGRGLQSLGLQSSEVIGQSVFQLYRDLPHVVDALHKVLNGEEQQLLTEVRGVHFESWMTPLRNANGETIGAMGVAHDVTSRVRAQESERSSSERFLKAFHASPAGILLTELPLGRILDANAAFAKLYGLSREELVGKTTLEIGLWPDAATRERYLQPALERNEQVQFRYQLQTKQGAVKPVQVVTEVVELDGRPCALFIVREAQRYQRIRRALARSQKRYRSLLKLAPVGIFRANQKGQIVDCNRYCLQLFNTSREALQTRGWWPFMPADYRKALKTQWMKSLETRQALTAEFPVTVNQADVWLQLKLEPGRSHRNFFGSLTDITQRKLMELELQNVNERLEENVRVRTDLLTRASITLEEQIFQRRRTYIELEKSEERWRALVQHAPDVILLVNPDGDITFINHTAIPREHGTADVIGRSIYDFTLEEFHEETREVMARVFQGGESVTHEVQAPGVQGERRWFQSHLSPIYHEGQVVGATAVVRDITDARHSAEQLRQTEDLLAHSGRVRMVGEMTAGFAHELGQPLSAISTYLEACLIRLRRDGQTSSEILDAMQEAVKEAQRAIRVVRGLREFLQRNELQRHSENLNQIVKDALRLGEVSLRKYQVDLQLELDHHLPNAQLDSIQVMQVLLNLMLNAAEAMHEARSPLRTIRIVTRCVQNKWVECEVADSGPGLPETAANAIFETFFTTKKAGLGLGLAISRRIVEAHGGQINAGNQPNSSGASFLVRLPVK